MTAPVINHVERGPSRIATQYRNSIRFQQFIAALMEQANEIEQALHQVAQITDIDLSEGVQLDVLGDIVGVRRIIPSVILRQFFGFQGAILAQTFGEEGDALVGGPFRDEDEVVTGTSVLSDPEFRLLIRAKIVKNHSRGTNDDILRGLDFIFDAPVGINDPGGMGVHIAVGRNLTTTELSLILSLDILPRPAGVKIRTLTTYDQFNYLGFDDQAGAQTFGEEGIDDGGLFAEESAYSDVSPLS